MSPEHSEGNWAFRVASRGRVSLLWGADPCDGELPFEQMRGALSKGKLKYLVGGGWLLETGVSLSKDQGVYLGC